MAIALNQRRVVGGDFVAELADFRLRPTTARQVDIADDKDGFVFAPSSAEAMEGRQAVVHVGWRGVARPPSSGSGAHSIAAHSVHSVAPARDINRVPRAFLVSKPCSFLGRRIFSFQC